jgi:ADP-ribose pyrophosphatase YjhB (NUDIX family)
MNNSIAPRLPEVVTRAYIFDNENKILLIKQQNNSQKWGVPYGCVQFGENVLDTAKRKAREDAGINVHPLGTLAVKQDIKAEACDGCPDHSIFFDVLCLGFGNCVKPSKVEECRWFTLDEALKLIESEEVKDVVDYCARKSRLGDSDILATGIN